MQLVMLVGGVLVVLVVLLGAMGLLLSRRWSVERSVIVDAAPGAVYPLIANFKLGWTQWSPFGQIEDPTVTFTYSGPDEGRGAVQSWEGKKLGTGTMEMTEVDPSRGIEYHLSTGGLALRGRLSLEPAGSSTRVVWSAEGELGTNPFFRYMGLFAGRIVGRSFEKGLAALKRVAEQQPAGQSLRPAFAVAGSER